MIRKHLFTALLLLAGMSLFAQEGTQSLAINAGYSTSILREESGYGNGIDTKSPLFGYKIGVVYENTIIKGFGMQIGLNYTYGGNIGKYKSVSAKVQYPKYKETFSLHQIEVPIDWQYKFEIAKQTYLILYTGPTIQVGISFKDRIKVLDSPTSSRDGSIQLYTMNVKGDIDMGGKYGNWSKYLIDRDNDGRKDNYNRLNITWGVGAGFQYQRYYIRGGYDFGIYSPYHDRVVNDGGTSGDWYRKGRLDQWAVKFGIYLWQSK